MKTEHYALRLVARKDRAGLEAMARDAAAGLAALDAFEGRAPADKSAATSEAPALTPRQIAAKAAADARWHPDRTASASAPHAPTHAVGIGSASAPHASGMVSASAAHRGGDKGGNSDLSVSPEKTTENPEKYPVREACAADADVDAKRARVRTDLFVDGTVDAWAEGIRAVSGRPVTSLRNGARNELIEIIVTHALDEADRRAWLRDKVERFARAYDPKYGGWTPSTFAKWMNSAEPAGVTPRASSAPRFIQRKNQPEVVTESLLEVGNG